MFSKPVQPGCWELPCQVSSAVCQAAWQVVAAAHMGAIYRRLWKHMIWLCSKELKNSWVSLKIVRVKPFQFILVITGTLTSRRIKTFLRPSHSEAKKISKYFKHPRPKCQASHSCHPYQQLPSQDLPLQLPGCCVLQEFRVVFFNLCLRHKGPMWTFSSPNKLRSDVLAELDWRQETGREDKFEIQLAHSKRWCCQSEP